MKPLHFAAAALIGLGCSTLPPNAAAAEYCVPLENGGSICGETQSATGKEYSVFKGIQYATAERWSSSVLTTSYEDNYPAKDFRNICPQPDYIPREGSNQSENCLYLNVWTPNTKEKSKDDLPVMVFIHGGAFIAGASSSKYPSVPSEPDNRDTLLYDGATFASEQNVILVTINYRLGALGFLNMSADGTTKENSQSNYGIRDQLNALQWVQDNIESFGGNKSNVTIFGESAGAMSVGLHLLSIKESQDKFQAAIMESNPIGYTYRDAKQGHTQASSFLNCLWAVRDKEIGCGTPRPTGKLPKNLSLEEIMEAQRRYIYLPSKVSALLIGLPGALPFTPIIDGSFIKSQPASQIRDGSPKPLMFGFNQNEGVYFANLEKGTLDTRKYNSLVERFFNCAPKGSCSTTILTTKSYDSKTDFSPEQMRGLQTDVNTALSNLINDFAFSCSNMAANPGKTQKSLWAYYFTQTDAIQDLPPPQNPKKSKDPLSNVCGPQNQWDNSCHAAELPFVFNSLPPKSDAPLTDLAMKMNTAWATFAKEYNTTGPGPDWQVWEKAGPDLKLNYLNSANEPPKENIFNSRECSNWLSNWSVKGVDYNSAQQFLQETLK